MGSVAEMGTSAFKSLKHRDGAIIVKNNRGPRYVAIHEIVHRCSNSAILSTWRGTDSMKV